MTSKTSIHDVPNLHPWRSLFPVRGIPVLLAALLFPAFAAQADDWPQWLGPQRDGLWRESGIVDTFPEEGPRLRWKVPIGAGYSGPAVAGGRVFVIDRQMAEIDSEKTGQNFSRGIIEGVERVLCFDEKSGEQLWEHEYFCTYTISYPAGPRTTPLVDENRVYTIGAEGNLHCLDAKTGKVKWAREFKRDYNAKTPLWGFASHPLVDGRQLICIVGGSPNALVVSFDKHNGRELWTALSGREPGYAPPTIVEAGGRRQLIVWHPESLNSLDPKNGRAYWKQPFKIKSGLAIATPRLYENLLFVSAFYNGPLMMKLDPGQPKATVAWRGQGRNERDTDALHCLMSTPWIEDGHIYGIGSYGHLRCIKVENGERVWETLAATTGGKPIRWANAFLVKHEDRFFIFNEQGELILAHLSPQGYEEIARARLLDPTNSHPRRTVVWSHPAFANRSIYARNDKELVCYSLAAGESGE